MPPSTITRASARDSLSLSRLDRRSRRRQGLDQSQSMRIKVVVPPHVVNTCDRPLYETLCFSVVFPQSDLFMQAFVHTFTLLDYALLRSYAPGGSGMRTRDRRSCRRRRYQVRHRRQETACARSNFARG